MSGFLSSGIVNADTIPDTQLDHFYYGPSIDNIGTWPDEEGSEPASSVNSPTISDINGTQAVKYNGDAHETATPLGTGTDDAYTFAVVYQVDDNNQARQQIVGDGEAQSNGWQFLSDSADNTYQIIHAETGFVDFGSPDTDPHVAVGSFDGSTITVDIDGSEAVNATISNPSSPTNQFSIGSGIKSGSTADELDGRVGAAGQESTASDAARRDELTNKLGDAFGISVST